MIEITPVSALCGGVLIGLASLLLLWCQGRIAGISGILSGVLGSVRGDWWWRVLFVSGLLAGGTIGLKLFGFPQPDLSGVSWAALVTGGFTVGFGAKLGNGCTSGHGICGIGRLSPRSVVATLNFMATAMITVYVLRHLVA